MTRSLLFVEDDQLDTAIMRRCLKQLDIQNGLVHKTDGEQALEYLRDCSGHLPCAILLDLNMPIEFLGHIKADASLRSIPVVVVTTSSSPQEVEACFRLGVVAYIIKDYEFHKFVEDIRRKMSQLSLRID